MRRAPARPAVTAIAAPGRRGYDRCMAMRFDLCDLPDGAATLRAEVRDFLAGELIGGPNGQPAMLARSWNGIDGEFSKKLGARGWIAMTWPKRYGGHERSALERVVVLEELLAAGAPVAAHWIADRQSGPLLLKFGTEELRTRILPGIARGETFFCIGMSEPGSGSDLASVRTRAVPGERDGVKGWIVNGTKVWTTMAQHAHYMIALVRTSGAPEDRHAGLSQLLVDLSDDGVTVSPIVNLAGDAEYNEVSFVDAFVPEAMLIGSEGKGWEQVMSELAYERSGPERYLSSIQLVKELVRAAGPEPDDRVAAALGRLAAHLAMLQAGASPNLEAAVVKEVGVGFEQEIPDIVHAITDVAPLLGGAALDRVMAYTTQVAPSFSLRGGTREIVRGIIARGLGLR